MKIITVEKAGLMHEMQVWGVQPAYAEFFLSKCADDGCSISLRPVIFNDTIDMNNKRQWLAVSVAFWCQAYREAETSLEQAEMLGAIRASYYLAALLGTGDIVTSIAAWWAQVYELHQLPALNHTPGRDVARSFILNHAIVTKH